MAHETLHRDDPTIEGSSPRSFGLVFAVVFGLIGLWPLMARGPLRWWALVVASVFLALALAAPQVLAPLNRAWMKFGLLLGRIVSPIMLSVLFFLVFMPMGVALRALGKDPLRLRKPAGVSTYWVERKPPGPPPASLNNQF